MFSRVGFFSLTNLRNKLPRFKRGMAAHAHQGEQDAGELAVRKYLPGNEHIVLAVLGFYTTLYLLYKVTKSSPKATNPVVSSHLVETSLNAIPSVDSADFGNWISQDGNFEKLLNSFDDKH